MDEWQADLAATLNRALNAAVDVTVYKETGVKQGAVWVPNNAQPSQVLQPAIGPGNAAGLREYLPWVLIGGAVLLVVWKIAK